MCQLQLTVNIHILRTNRMKYLSFFGSERASQRKGQVSIQKNSSKISHDFLCWLSYQISVRYICTAGIDTTFFCFPSIRQSSMLAPRWSTALSTIPAFRPLAVDARFKRVEAILSQWHAASFRSLECTFFLSEAKLKARDRCTAVARGAAEYSTSSSKAMFAFSFPHIIKSKTNCKAVKTTQHETSNTVDLNVSNMSPQCFSNQPTVRGRLLWSLLCCLTQVLLLQFLVFTCSLSHSLSCLLTLPL